MVEAPEKFEITVFAVAHEIAGPVETFAGHVAQRMYDESFRGQRRTVQISTGETRASDIQAHRGRREV